MSGQYVQFGCGLSAPPNWRNFDNSPTLRLQKLPLIGRLFNKERFPKWPQNVEVGDIVKGLPIETESCKAIYASHVLEHLAHADFRIALNNMYSYLVHRGVFRLVVPDLEYLAREYLEPDNATAAHDFMIKSVLGHKTRLRGLEGLFRSFFGNSHHLWMWDFQSLFYELEQVGFDRIRDSFRDVCNC